VTINHWKKANFTGFLDSAIKCYDKVLEHDSKNASAWYKKGIMLSSQYKQNESQAAFNIAANLSPENSHVLNAQGLGLYVSAKLDEAVEDQLIDLNSEHTTIDNKDTSIKILTGSVGHKETWNYTFNVTSQTRRIAAGSNTADNVSELALVFEDPNGNANEDHADVGTGKIGPIEAVSPQVGRWTLKVYGYIIPREIDSVSFKINLINQLYSSERFKISLDAYDQATRLDPMSLTPIIQKATVLMESGEFKDAKETIDSALKIDPSSSKAWYTKGMILIKQGYYEDALKSLSVSIELAPGFADAWYYKGIDLQYLGRYNEARIALNQSSMLGYTNSIAIPPTTDL
jgi:tetratricopeptide (TPR) repeat protein